MDVSAIKLYKAATHNDTGANGGRMSANEIASGVKNAVWPDAYQTERQAGSTKLRKVFYKVADANNTALQAARIFVETVTAGADRVLIFPGSQTNTQADLTGSERLYGAGALNADVSVGASQITVSVENASDAIFQNGDLVRISNKTTVDAVSGTEEYLRLAASSAVSWNANVATLTLDTGVTTENAYLASNTRVAPVIEAGDIQVSVGTITKVSTSGVYNGAVAVDAIAGIEQTWTITFTAATTFGCVGDTIGATASGSVSSDFAPTNATFARPYFTLPSSGFGGTFEAGDTLTFATHPAAYPFWQKKIIPPNSDVTPANQVIVGITGQAAQA